MIQTNYISYKDSAARVFKKEGLYYRCIFNEYKAEYDHLMQSGLYRQLQAKELLIAHEEIDFEEGNENPQIYKLIKPTQISFQSYPFEWSYTQWRKAILAYLAINKIALRHGMILKDATPYNFYLKAGKAIMLDTSSFEFFKAGDKWMAYKQFCSEFFTPLALMHYSGQRWSRITKSHLRGLPLNFVSKQLPLKSWFNISTFLHIHLHSKYANAEGETNAIKAQQKSNRGFSVEKLVSLSEMIHSTVKGWRTPYPFEKHWSTYYENDIEFDAYLEDKEKTIKGWLENIKPNRVLDLGANTGKFSFLASQYAERVVALEYDDICVDRIEKDILDQKIGNLDVLTMDLSDATSNLGVLDMEFASIYLRAKSDMVMALALIHHLHISNQLSFDQIAEMLVQFTNQYAIVEFIPIEDSKVQLLMKEKAKDFKDYSEKNFIRALSKFFMIKESQILQISERKLFLLEKIN